MTFASDAEADFNAIILENGDVFNVIRQTDTDDSMGTVSDVSETSFRIVAYLKDISKKDRMVHDMGLAVPGNRMLYAQPSDSLTSGGVATSNSVKEGDILKDRNNYKWRVIKILHEPFIVETQIYKKCVVQSIGLEGS